MQTSPLTFLALPLAGLALTLGACAREAERSAAPAPVRVELPAGELAIASLPPGLRLISSDPAEAQLAPAAAEAAGTLTLTVAPPEPSGINLVQLVKDTGAEFEGKSGGEFLGRRELVVPWGSAFTARGRYEEGGGQVEELRVFALHPGDTDRLLTLVYRYPATGTEASGKRFAEALALLGELEPVKR